MFRLDCFRTIIGITVMFLCIRCASAQRMNIQPSTISVGGTTVSGTPTPTTSPEVVVMECTLQGIGVSVQEVFSMYIYRGSSQFIEISSGSNGPQLSPYVPNDIRTKAPTLEGTVDPNNALNSRLKATFKVSQMDCLDEATYRCEIFYKPVGSTTTSTNATMNLNVNVLPRDLQIRAEITQNFVATNLQNQSMIDPGEQVEFTCTGYTGSSDSTLIEWFRKTSPSLFFQRFYPTQAGDTIDDGFPSAYQCEYTRTSKLRFTMSSTDTTRMTFRCDVATLLTSGATYRAYSEEFHIRPGITITNGMSTFPSGTVLIVLSAIATIFKIL